MLTKLQDVKLQLFENAKSTQVFQTVSLDRIESLIKESPPGLLEVYASLADGDKRTVKQTKIKAVTYDTLFEGVRSNKTAKSMNPLIAFDIDKKDNEDTDLQELKAQLQECKHVVVCHYTISGGLRIVFYVAPTPVIGKNDTDTKKEYERIVTQLELYIKNRYNTQFKLDENAAHPHRLSFITHDSEPYINLEATPFFWVHPRQYEKSQEFEMALCFTLLAETDYLDKQERDEWMNMLFAIANIQKFTETMKPRPYTRRLMRAVASLSSKNDPTKIEGEINSIKRDDGDITLGTLYEYVKVHTAYNDVVAIQRWCKQSVTTQTARNRAQREEEKIKEKESQVEMAERDNVLPKYSQLHPEALHLALLKIGWTFKLDVFAVAYYAKHQRYTRNKWNTLDKDTVTLIQMDLRKNYEYMNGNPWHIDTDPLYAQLLHISQDYQENDVIDYFNTLIKPEEVHASMVEDISELLVSNWITKLGERKLFSNKLANLSLEEDKAIAQWMQRWIFHSTVERAYSPGGFMDRYPVLIGLEGGEGKSSIAQYALPPELSHRFIDTNVLTYDKYSQQIEQISDTAIVELAEFPTDTRNGIKWEPAKPFMSRKSDKIRLPYDRRPITIDRHFTMIGTTNKMFIFPNDAGVFRRFVPMQIEGTSPLLVHVLNEYRDQLWKEAIILHHLGISSAFPSTLDSQARKLSELCMKPSAEF